VLEVFLYSPQESVPVLLTVGSLLGVLWNRTEMSWQFNLEGAEEVTWQRKTSPDEKILAGNCHTNGWGLEGEGP
jgi:hypothetical protein